MAESILSGTIMGLCALLMIGIGICQINSKKPVGFYSGVKPPEAEELTDVKAWNSKHGMMWLLYGLCIMLAWVCGFVMGDSILLLIPFSVGLLLPIPCMVFYHNRLVKKYLLK